MGTHAYMNLPSYTRVAHIIARTFVIYCLHVGLHATPKSVPLKLVLPDRFSPKNLPQLIPQTTFAAKTGPPHRFAAKICPYCQNQSLYTGDRFWQKNIYQNRFSHKATLFYLCSYMYACLHGCRY